MSVAAKTAKTAAKKTRKSDAKTKTARPAQADSRVVTIGDILAHPVHGPVRVLAHRERTVRGERREYVDLEVIGDAMRISVPSDDGQIVGMRDLLSEKEITEVLDWLQETAPERPKRETWAHRMKSLTMQLQSGKLSERVSVIRYILQASGISPKSLAERNMLRSALDPLATEIAIARGIEKDAAEQLLVETAALGAPTAEDEKVAA